MQGMKLKRGMTNLVATTDQIIPVSYGWEDTLRKKSGAAVSVLHSMGLASVLVTGAHRSVGESQYFEQISLYLETGLLILLRCCEM